MQQQASQVTIKYFHLQSNVFTDTKKMFSNKLFYIPKFFPSSKQIDISLYGNNISEPFYNAPPSLRSFFGPYTVNMDYRFMCLGKVRV